jgi:hypothetical protein
MICKPMKPCDELNGYVLKGRSWQIYNRESGHSEEGREAYLREWRGDNQPQFQLGDMIETALKSVGVHQAVKRASTWLGVDCGCNERKEKLNQLGAWAKRWWDGKKDNAKEYLLALLRENEADAKFAPSEEPEMRVRKRPTIWSYGIMTIPQRFATTLPHTVNSLKEAGFDNPRLFVDGCNEIELMETHGALLADLEVTYREPAVKHFGNWILSMGELYIRDPNADYYAMFQDDIICSNNLRPYLEKTCPTDARGYWNLFTFPENEHLATFDKEGQRRPQEIVGWYESNQLGKGAVALVFHREAAVRLLSSSFMWNRPKDPDRGWRNIDGGIVQAMVLSPRDGWREFVHNPSLVQHVGMDSTLKHTSGWHGAQAISKCFLGEEFDCMTLLKESASATG